MTREERRALLGDDVIAQIHERVAETPMPGPEVVDDLRRILARPGRVTSAAKWPTATRPAAKAA
ncbi:hypothetical protein ACH49_13455 [Streptomyces leeuwenhoekii]|uniref:Anti-sigma factor NepR domain-containing protein n=1 Tax=Streptomyces leeuwenhoekii TaxID=1437453 RepID=A0ABR5HYW9_STRLW|nr:hypothetical protein [Streptomyces leeuwenhoekii]KMS79063.1 hypothetical protein ACH49_13455 [Streptomyces leeuwenhoekii]